MTTDDIIIENLRAENGKLWRVAWASEKIDRDLGMPRRFIEKNDLDNLLDDANELHLQLNTLHGLHDPDPLLTKVENDGRMAKHETD